jgi:adenylyltransferase/sulfurtransferase
MAIHPPPMTEAESPPRNAQSDAAFSTEELRRYSRHLVLPGVGEAGQHRLKRGSVLLVGAGGLGSPIALYLAAAGVGRLGLVDADRVDLTNLQRQILYGSATIGQPKVEAARARLHDVNPEVRVDVYEQRLTSANALDLIRDYDVVVDGSDNFPTRYLVNDACVLLGKPNVYGSVIRFEGQASVFSHGDGPCYRCLFREPPPPELATSCEEGGVFGVLPGLIGVIQATETVKLLLGLGDVLAGRLLLVDALRMRFHTIALARDPQCRACGTREITQLIDYDEFCAGGRTQSVSEEISVAELQTRLKNPASRPIQLLDVREPWEWNIARLPNARLIPLSRIESALHDLERSADIVVYCHHGIRSLHAMQFLREAGFETARSLAGGIDRWAVEVDSSVARY